MKKFALCMTVGTGIGEDKEERINSLAHGLLVSTLHYRPDKVFFFGSKESKDTVASLKKQYSEERGGELESYEFIKLNNVDDFDECFGKIRKKIEEVEVNYEIVIDYTSGTKTMTMSAAICAVLYHKKLSLISGKRDNRGIVKKGTEKIMEQNLYSAYDGYLIEKVKDLFNSYQFREAKNILGEIIEEEKYRYRKMIDAYDLWDKFNHKEAYKFLNSIKSDENKEFLGKLNNSNEKGGYILADLLNNAKRRASEGKYDDAVARLYRAFELIAQKKLSEFEIVSSNVDITKIPDEFKEKYESLRSEGKIKIGLFKDYELLSDIDCDLGREFIEDKKLKNLLKSRNDSILAHGLEPVEKETYDKLFEKTIKYAKEVVENLEDLMKKTEFPKI